MKTVPLLLLPVIMLLVPVQCTNQKNASAEQRITAIENGLIGAGEFGDLNLLFDKERNDTLKKYTLTDRMKAYNVPGVSIAVIEDYKLAWTKTYGVMEAGKDQHLDDASLFQAASCSKPLAVVIVLKLVEEGKLDLDEDVNTYLHSWKIPYDSLNTRVTLRQLITHQSGINRPGDGYDLQENSTPTLIQVLNGELPAINDPFHFDFQPGTVYHYSNFGYMIIQLVLEDYLKLPYKDIVSRYIFKPLNMNSSLMEYPVPEHFRSRLTTPHNQAGVPQDYGLHPTALANAGLLTTPADLSRFMIDLMLANEGKSSKIISPESARLMFTQTAEIDPEEFSGFSRLGFGFFLMGNAENFYFAHPGGNNSGASCAMIGSLKSGDGIIVMTNGLYGLYLTMELVAAVASEYNWPVID